MMTSNQLRIQLQLGHAIEAIRRECNATKNRDFIELMRNALRGAASELELKLANMGK